MPEQSKLAFINYLFGKSESRAAGIYPSVEIEQSHFVVDLTEWIPAPSGGDTSKCCKVTTEEDMLARRLRKDARYLAKRAATTGAEPKFTSYSHDVSYIKSSDARTGGPRMTDYDVLLDISKEPVNTPFKAQLRSERFGAFRDPNSEWTAASIFQPTRTLTIEVHFPESKPGRNFRFSVAAEADGSNYTPLNPEPGEYEIDGNTIKWSPPSPRLGYIYRIDWDW